jgi:hypothetical protein
VFRGQGSVKFSIQEQLLRRNVKRSRGGLVFRTHRLVYHSTLGSRVIKKSSVFRGQDSEAVFWTAELVRCIGVSFSCVRAPVYLIQRLGFRVWGLGFRVWG